MIMFFSFTQIIGEIMKGWKLTAPLKLEEKELAEGLEKNSRAKVKVTKALITLADVLRYNGELDVDGFVLGSSGIGIVSEIQTNLFGLEKGKHVYIEPNRPCNDCVNCKSGNVSACSNLQIAGEDFDGFLSDFVETDTNNLFLLPDSVSDFEALFIKHIALAITVVDKLKIQKGDYVAIVGANNFGNILAQLLIYYQAVPIVIASNTEDYNIAKDSGIYYVLNKDDNWQKEVMQITSGRMTESVVFISDCNIPATKAFSLAAFNARVAYTGVSYKNNSVSFTQAVRKQLQIICVNSGIGNTAAGINLIANKALNLSHLRLDSANYESVPQTLKSMSETLDKTDKIYETIVEMV